MYCKYSERLQSLVRTECTDLSHSQASWPSSNNQQVVVIILRWRPCWRVHDSDTGNLPLLLILKAQTHKTNTKNTLSEEGLWPQLCLAVGWTWVALDVVKWCSISDWQKKKKNFISQNVIIYTRKLLFCNFFVCFQAGWKKKTLAPRWKH